MNDKYLIFQIRHCNVIFESTLLRQTITLIACPIHYHYLMSYTKQDITVLLLSSLWELSQNLQSKGKHYANMKPQKNEKKERKRNIEGIKPAAPK